MLKLKPEHLRVGDILYPIERKIGDLVLVSCGRVTQKMNVVDPNTLQTLEIAVAKLSTCREDGVFVSEELKLDDNKEYHVIFREYEG